MPISICLIWGELKTQCNPHDTQPHKYKLPAAQPRALLFSSSSLLLLLLQLCYSSSDRLVCASPLPPPRRGAPRLQCSRLANGD